MKRVHDVVWPIIGLGAVAVSSWLLFKDLRGLSFANLKSALFSITPAGWLLAMGSTCLAYAALAWYDQIALLHLGRRINWRYVAVASFTAYALGHNIGASVLSGAVVRYRAYSVKGLGVGEIGVLVAFCSFTFALGAATVGGFSLLFPPELIERFDGAPDWLGKAGAAALIAAPSLFVAGSLLHFPPLRIGDYQLVYPRPRIAAWQLLAALWSWSARPASSISPFRRPPILALRSCSGSLSPRSRSRSLAMRRAASACSNSRSLRRCRTRRRPTSSPPCWCSGSCI
jgi:glycosyltransferase 2 family protein